MHPSSRGLFECEANPFLQQGKVNLPGPMTQSGKVQPKQKPQC